MKIILLLALFSVMTISIAFEQASALIQFGGIVDMEISPGETKTFEWGLQSSDGSAITLEMGSRDWGSQFLSYPETLDVPAGDKGIVVISVTIPEDHPGDVSETAVVTATQFGEEGGMTVVNVRAARLVQLTILPNENQEYWSNTAYVEPEKAPEPEKVQVTEPVIDVPEKEIEAPKGGLQIGSAPETEGTPETEEGGGCLISTATYGSELAPQVQLLREIRDNKLLTTESGSAFMSGFNSLYYSFSPAIADLERQSPIFREAVKITITPLLTSLSILNYVDMDSESDVLFYGISLILLNAGMYFVAPAIIITKLRKKF